MRKLALVSLAALAAAALPAVAQAQPRAGHSWGQPGQRVVVRHGDPRMGMPGNPRMHGREFRRDFRRIERGHFVPQFWWGPQFQVQHWQMYGFPQPMPGHRWIRYYDDALMIDDRGRVRDGRYGMDWDRYGDRWAEDERGIPAYVGDGDYHPDDRDYAMVDEVHREGGWDYSEYRDQSGPSCGHPRPGPCGQARRGPGHHPMPHPAPAPAYGYGGGYSYGYTCCATVTITETIVETGGESYVEEYVEEQVVRQRARRVHRRPPPRRPIRGERG